MNISFNSPTAQPRIGNSPKNISPQSWLLMFLPVRSASKLQASVASTV
jgi:hypothetical protein